MPGEAHEGMMPSHRQMGLEPGVAHHDLRADDLDYFERALNLCQEMGDARGEAATLRLLGFVHLAQVDGDRSISLSLFRKSLSLSKKNHDLLGQVATRLSLR